MLDKNTNKTIRKCFWIFFFFVLTEGIFRRWLLPGMSNVFLVIRDPFVIYAVFLGIKRGLLNDIPPKIMMVLGILSFMSTLAFGHGNIIVAIYGVRIIFFYFPFMYICSKVLNRYDVMKIGKVFVLMLIPMVILNIVQFFSPQSSFVNIGVGGDEEGAGFSGGAMGYFRPPGIFTFVAGLTDYFACTLGFLLFYIFDKQMAKNMGLSKFLIMSSVMAYMISLPISISRTHLVQSAYIILISFYIMRSDPKKIKFVLILLCFCLALFPILMLNDNFSLFIDVFSVRFNGANESEGGLGSSILERTFGWLFRAIDNSSLLGYGSGFFTNFGMKMIMGDVANWSGNIAKVASSTEMEWGRIICEDGIVIGLMILFMRFYIAFSIFRKSLKQLIKTKDILLWLCMPVCILFLIVSQLKSGYNLGFTAIATIVCLTLIQHPIINNNKHLK